MRHLTPFFSTTTEMVADDKEFASALVNNGTYNQLVYLGHGVPGALAVDEKVGGNVIADDSGVWKGTRVDQLNKSFFKIDPAVERPIILCCCNSAVSYKGYGNSMTVAFAQHFMAPTTGAGAGIGFEKNGEPYIRTYRWVIGGLSNLNPNVSGAGGWSVAIPKY